MDGVRDVRCDVYSLAATAYFSVTGMRPPGSFQRKIKGEPLQEPVTRVALSGELNRAIVEGMALELGERPEDIARWVARVEPQPPPRVTVEPQPQPRERTTPPSSTPPVETAAPKQETVAPKQEVIISTASFIFTTETPPSLTQPVETAAPKQKATISNATFAIVSVLVFLGLVVLAVPLGMGNNLWVWAVVWVYAVVWAVIGAAAADRTVGAEAVIGAVAVAGAGAVIGAVAGALAIGFNLSLTGGLLVGCSLWFVGLIVGILNAGNIFVFYVFLVAPFASGVMASVLVDLELAVIAASTAGAITGGFPLGIFGITEVLSDRGYSKQQAAFMVSVLVTFGLSIGWLLGRFVFS
jgi:serine/threonine-protein kinase